MGRAEYAGLAGLFNTMGKTYEERANLNAEQRMKQRLLIAEAYLNEIRKGRLEVEEPIEPIKTPTAGIDTTTGLMQEAYPVPKRPALPSDLDDIISGKVKTTIRKEIIPEELKLSELIQDEQGNIIKRTWEDPRKTESLIDYRSQMLGLGGRRVDLQEKDLARKIRLDNYEQSLKKQGIPEDIRLLLMEARIMQELSLSAPRNEESESLRQQAVILSQIAQDRMESHYPNILMPPGLEYRGEKEELRPREGPEEFIQGKTVPVEGKVYVRKAIYQGKVRIKKAIYRGNDQWEEY